MATREQKSGKIFYGWWIVLVAVIGLSVHAAPILIFTFGVFLKSFSEEFGWSRGQVSLAPSLSNLGLTVAAPFLGHLVDRFGARRVILPSTLLFGAGVLSVFSFGPPLALLRHLPIHGSGGQRDEPGALLQSHLPVV